MPDIKSIRIDATDWQPYPIDAAQILEGDPKAEVQWLQVSGEGEPAYYAGIWSADRSRFTWRFDMNESAHILAGRIRVTDERGRGREYKTGDVVFFPKGSRTEWLVIEPLRKFFVDSA